MDKLRDHGELMEISKPVVRDLEFAPVVETMLQERRPIGLLTEIRRKAPGLSHGECQNPADVLWAMSTRADGNRDILIAPMHRV